MARFVRLLVDCCRPVNKKILKGRKDTLLCSYLSTCFICIYILEMDLFVCWADQALILPFNTIQGGIKYIHM